MLSEYTYATVIPRLAATYPQIHRDALILTAGVLRREADHPIDYL